VDKIVYKMFKIFDFIRVLLLLCQTTIAIEKNVREIQGGDPMNLYLPWANCPHRP
jgi:hypothetical protein